MPTGLWSGIRSATSPCRSGSANYVLMSSRDGGGHGGPRRMMSGISNSPKNMALPIKPVIDIEGCPYSLAAWPALVHSEHGRCVNSGRYDGLDYERRGQCGCHDLSAKVWARNRTTWRLRDWGISRQR